MENLKIKEVRRRLNQNREKFRYDLQYMCKLFEVDSKDFVKKFDWLSDEFIKWNIEKDEVEKKINDLQYKFEKLKIDFLIENNIDVKEKVLSVVNGDKLLDEVWKMGFINNDMFEVIKEEMFRRRKYQKYEFNRWM